MSPKRSNTAPSIATTGTDVNHQDTKRTKKHKV